MRGRKFGPQDRVGDANSRAESLGRNFCDPGGRTRLAPQPSRSNSVAEGRHICYYGLMRTTLECLAKASEMEERAAQCAIPLIRSQYLDAATRWRDLARRALIHDQLREGPQRPTIDAK